MARRFEIVANDENKIFDQLEDGLFFDELSKDQLELYVDLKPISDVDGNVARAIDRAMKIILNNTIGVTINRRRNQKK
ncbi:MAG TPA: hypothetical protein PJ984_00615 [Candidatus Saccharibacteria bacterium]|jgi:hypothetical protein|nr:hypothetical protein [Candidatus Saccharibacteria bacterium]